MDAIISFQEGTEGEAIMFTLIMIEAVQRERERQIHEEVRRRRLVLDAAGSRDLAAGPTPGSDRRDSRRGQPARLATP